jgi:hypothetical protein
MELQLWLTGGMMKVEAGMPLEIGSEEFTRQMQENARRAREESFALGLPVFYRDWETGIDIMEHPKGRRFEIRYITGAPRDRNYEVIRELTASAA